MRTWILIGVFLGVVIIAFGVFVFKITESPVLKPTNLATGGATIADIHLTDTYKKGVHTIKGSATVPNACTTLAENAAVEGAASSTPVIRIDLSAAIDDGMCLQLPKPVSFTFSVTAPANAAIQVYTNGALATSTP